MILKKEIQSKSAEWKVPPETVEKDWVLGHILSSIFSIKKHKDGLIFKGGTCLRKCFFPDYRFSEDLDFTARQNEYKITIGDIEEITNIAEINSGILFHTESFKELKYEGKLTGYQIKLKYWGANHPKNLEPPPTGRWTTSIKLEIIVYEKLIFRSLCTSIFHDYSDKLNQEGLSASCYDLKEMMAEKLRALIQRSYTAPRDYYDIYYLKKEFNDSDWALIRSAFEKKAVFKGYDPASISKLFKEPDVRNLTKAWKNSLGHQIPAEQIPDIKLVIDEVRTIVKKDILRK